MIHRPRCVLLTGARGFLGRPCRERLCAQGWTVHAITSGPPPKATENCRWHQVDLLDVAAVRSLLRTLRPSHLLHLAWHRTDDSRYTTHADNFRWVAAGLELLHAFVDSGGTRTVFTGSCAEYDWGAGLCSEAGTPLRPPTTYGLTKRTLSELFQDFVAHHGPKDGGAWARPFFLFGPGERPGRLVASAVNALLAGDSARCLNGNLIRDYLCNLDAAEALVDLLESQVRGPINIGSGDPVRLGDLVRRIATKLGREDRVEIQNPPLTSGDFPMVVADVRRLRGDLGWTPSRTLDAALEETIAWWRRRRASCSETEPMGLED